MKWSFSFNTFADKLLINEYCDGNDIDDLSKMSEVMRFAYLYKILYSKSITMAKQNSQIMLVKHEDLCVNPIECFQELFDHFNLTWTGKVQKYINRTTIEKRPGDFSTYRITKDQINKWKREMTTGEIEQVRTFVEPFNLPFYDKESDWSF